MIANIFFFKRNAINSYTAGFLIFLLISSFALPVIWIYFKKAKWRLWAFGSVEDYGLLKKMAMAERLIEPQYHWTDRITNEEKEYFARLEEKYIATFKFRDDIELGKETYVYYSKFYVWGFLFLPLLAIVCLILGYDFTAFKVINNKALITGCIGLSWGLITFGKFYLNNRKRLLNKIPVIILSNSGIVTDSTGFVGWEEIMGETIEFEGFGAKGKEWLEFSCNMQPEKVEIDIKHLNFKASELVYLLNIYRNRFEQNRR